MKQISLKNKLIFTIIPLVIVTVTVLLLIPYRQSSQAIMSQNTTYLEQTVQKTVDELALWIEEREREITLLSQEAVLRNACSGRDLVEAQQRLTSYHQESEVYESIILLDPQGVLFMSSNRQQIGLDVAKMPEYAENIRQAQQGQMWIGTVAVSPDTGRPILLITIPIMEYDKVIGIVGTPIELNYFSDRRVSPQRVGKDGYFAMLDQTGKILAHPDKEMIMSENSLAPEILKQMHGQYSYNHNGVEKMIQFQTCARTGWVVGATITKSELFQEIRRSRNMAMSLGVVCIVVVSLTIWRIMGANLVAPIRAAVEYVKKVSDGDLSEILEVTRRDELGELLQAMSQMIAKLRQVVSDVKHAAGNVASGSQTLSSGAEEMSNGATEQAAAGEEASSSMEEMAANIRQNADNATQTEKIATQAADDAQKSGEAVARTVTAMREIVRKITIIEEIARQTHTLSLNATIEAAKAQEYGKGFAVVAAEVRALASRSQDASSEINQMASQSIDVAERAGDMLTKLVPDIQKTADLVQEIGAASREQSSGTEQINRAIQQLDSVTQQNSAVAEEMAATSEELASQAEQLQHTIAFFTVSENGSQHQDEQNQSHWEKTTVAHLKKPAGPQIVGPHQTSEDGRDDDDQTHDYLDMEFEHY